MYSFRVTEREWVSEWMSNWCNSFICIRSYFSPQISESVREDEWKKTGRGWEKKKTVAKKERKKVFASDVWIIQLTSLLSFIDCMSSHEGEKEEERLKVNQEGRVKENRKERERDHLFLIRDETDTYKQVNWWHRWNERMCDEWIGWPLICFSLMLYFHQIDFHLIDSEFACIIDNLREGEI